MNRTRESQPVRPCYRPTGAVLLLTVLLLGAGPSQPWVSAADKALPPDLALVPPGDPLFFSVRVADLVNSQPGKKFLEDLGKDADQVRSDLQRELGLPLEEIERVTVLPTRRVLIVRTVTPYDRKKLLETLVPHSQRVRYHGRIGYEDQGIGVGVYPASDRVYLKGWNMRWTFYVPGSREEDSLSQLLALADNQQKPLAEALRLAAENHDVVVGLSPAALLLFSKAESQAQAIRAMEEAQAARKVQVAPNRSVPVPIKEDTRPALSPPGESLPGPGPSPSGGPPLPGGPAGGLPSYPGGVPGGAGSSPPVLPVTPPPPGGGVPGGAGGALPASPPSPDAIPPGAGLPGAPGSAPPPQLPPQALPRSEDKKLNEAHPANSTTLALQPQDPFASDQDAPASSAEDKDESSAPGRAQKTPDREAQDSSAPGPFDDLPPEMWPFRPLLQAQSASLVIDLKDELTAEARLTFPKEELVGDGETAVRTGLYVLRQVVSRSFGELDRDAALNRQVRPLVGSLQAALKAASIKTEGPVVVVSARLPVDAGVLAGMALRVRRSNERIQSINNLKQIALAFHSMNDTYNFMPPAAICGKDGRPLLSWRVAILPYIEQQNLYNQFRLDEPWDSPTNKKLLAQMPKIYAPVRGTTKEPYSTYYQVFVGPQTPFNQPPNGQPPFGARGPNIVSFTDGTSNTFLVVEAGEAVPWTKPEDIPYDVQKPVPKLGGPFGSGFLAAMADGSVQFFPQGMDEETLRNLIRPNDGNVINWAKIGGSGHPSAK